MNLGIKFAGLGGGALGFGFQGLGTDLQRQLAGLGGTSQFAQNVLGQQAALGGVGAQQRQLEQQFINDAIRRFEFGQNQDLLRLQAIGGAIQGNPLLGAGTSTGSSTAPQLSGLSRGISGGLGGATAGAAIGSLFAPAATTAGGAAAGAASGSIAGPVGAGIGGLLGLIGAFG